MAETPDSLIISLTSDIYFMMRTGTTGADLYAMRGFPVRVIAVFIILHSVWEAVSLRARVHSPFLTLPSVCSP